MPSKPRTIGTLVTLGLAGLAALVFFAFPKQQEEEAMLARFRELDAAAS